MKYTIFKFSVILFAILYIQCHTAKKQKRHKKSKRGSYKTRCPSFSINPNKNFYI